MDVPTPTRRLNVLVVDDNPDAAESLALLLRAAGHDAGVAWNGLDALDMARENPPDIVLLDLGMPCMNGYETAHRFRADPATRSAVLVAVTGWGSEDDRKRTQAAGFARHLVKPVDPAAVLALLEEHAGDPAAAG
jgi:CheY-like chemotaxis protein